MSKFTVSDDTGSCDFTVVTSLLSLKLRRYLVHHISASSSTPCTLVYLTELWPTFKNFRRPRLLTWGTVIFRFRTSSVSVFARQSPYGL
jgi:hypothetical protein